jgi:hypothetical protein
MARTAAISCTAVFYALVASERCALVSPFLFGGGEVAHSKHGQRFIGGKKFLWNSNAAGRMENAAFRLESSCAKDNDLMSTTSQPDDAASFYQCILQRFQGDFDNYNQVVRDRQHGLMPAEGGGHEHIHCTLVPCPNMSEQSSSDGEKWVIAAFYLNGNPKQIFRFRMYRLIPPTGEDSLENSVRLKLHTLSPDLDRHLRGCSEQPWTWWNETYSMWSNLHVVADLDTTTPFQPEQWTMFLSEGLQGMVSPLKGCDVLWNPEWIPSNHSYLYKDEYSQSTIKSPAKLPEAAFHATMEAGPSGVIVDSISMIPGKRILIKDELSLWEDEFWINDRGYDPDANTVEEPLGALHNNVKDSGGMPYVYGNRRGIPYKLERVATMSFVNDVDEQEASLLLHRVIVNSDIEWTLGEDYRTTDLYQQKLNQLEV